MGLIAHRWNGDDGVMAKKATVQKLLHLNELSCEHFSFMPTRCLFNYRDVDCGRGGCLALDGLSSPETPLLFIAVKSQKKG